MKPIIVVTLLFAFCSINPPPASAWSRAGHYVVATIAETHLTPQARTSIQTILGPNTSLSDVADWADNIKSARPKTRPWHYINLPLKQDVTLEDLNSYCPRDNCILGQIKKDITLLKSPSTPLNQKIDALNFLVHFMGDLHMPFHCVDDNDRGGNEKIIRVSGLRTNMHAYWDHLLQKKDPQDPAALADRLEEAITYDQAATWGKGTVDYWCFETYQFAKKKIYPDYRRRMKQQGNRIVQLDSSYRATMQPLAYQQLEKGGIRLATVLNQILESN